MLRFAKYYLLINLYRNSKHNLLIVLVSIVMMTAISCIFSDLTAMATSGERYFLVGIKWFLLFCLLGLIAYQLRKISLQRSLAFKRSTPNKHDSIQKEKLMTKERLQSRTELIVKKYKELP